MLRDFPVFNVSNFEQIDTIPKGSEGKVVDFLYQRHQQPMNTVREFIGIRVLFGCTTLAFANTSGAVLGFNEIEVI